MINYDDLYIALHARNAARGLAVEAKAKHERLAKQADEARAELDNAEAEVARRPIGPSIVRGL